MILHIFNNQNFIEITKNEFEKSQNNNVYVILSSKKNIQNTVPQHNHQSLVSLIKLQKFSCIVIHYLTSDKACVIIDSGYTGKIHWSIWGNDMYNNAFGFSANQIFDHQTKKYLKKNQIKISDRNRLLNNIVIKKIAFKLYFLIKRKQHPSLSITKLIPKITSYSTVIPSEQHSISSFLKNAQYKPFTYGNIETLIPNKYINFSPKKLGTEICIGNSATPSNNHISIFSQLDNTTTVRIPFAYGINKYKEAILNDFNNYRHFNFSTEFVSYEDYTESLTHSNTLIINTHRQQAVGTILIALYLGMRVYFNSKNPTYHFLKHLGADVFDFWKDFEHYKNSTMSIEQVLNNRKSIENYWGNEASNERMKAF